MRVMMSASRVRLRDVLFGAVLVFLLADRALPMLSAFAADEPPVIAAAGPLPSAFTFQGFVTQDGTPLTGNYDMEFRLWDDGVGGAEAATALVISPVGVANGLFSVAVDFGAAPFAGNQRWVEPLVRPVGSSDPRVSLGRQAITATPYAIFALNIPVHDHFGEEWSGDIDAGIALKITNSGTGIGTEGLRVETPSGNPIVGVNAEKGYAAITGVNAGTDCAAFSFNLVDHCIGMYAEASTGSQGLGLFAKGSETGIQAEGSHAGIEARGSVYGVSGVATSGAGIGVNGYSDSGWAVYGRSFTESAVRGMSTSDNGVEGESWSGFAGVYGSNRGTGCGAFLVCVGVYGHSSSGHGVGVYGSGQAIGVYGQGTAYAGYFDGLVATNSIIPITDNAYILGDLAHRWNTLYAVNSVINTSDARLKRDIVTVPYGLDAVMNLRPVSYLWNEDDGSGGHLGFLAQDVAEVIPEVVAGDPSDPAAQLGLKYTELIPVLARAIQEQQGEIDGLRGGDLRSSSISPQLPGDAAVTAVESPVSSTGWAYLAVMLAAVFLAGLSGVVAGRRFGQR